MRTRFGDFIFDSDTRELLAGGRARRLSPKAFLLLEALIGSAPQAMAREELYRRVWGDTFVEEANLPNLISEIRSALGENRQSARFIKTIHGFGYAFGGELSVEPRLRLHASPAGRTIYLQWRREELPLRPGENIVGRGEEADVMIDSGAVSRRHARIVVGPGGTTIEDLGSKNGTFVREERISEVTEVYNGDEVRFGVISVIFRSLDRSASTMTGIPC